MANFRSVMPRPAQTLATIVREQRIVWTMVLAVGLLALVNWTLRPDEALRWLRAMLTLPALWLLMTLWRLATLRSRRRRGTDGASVTRYFVSAMTLAFLPLGLVEIVALGLKIWSETGGHRVDLDVERRILGLAVSAVFVIVGNALPKILTPLSMLPRELAERVTAARRFLGTTLVVLGLLTALAFVWAPLALAANSLRWAAAAGLLAFVGAIVWMNVGAAGRKG